MVINSFLAILLNMVAEVPAEVKDLNILLSDAFENGSLLAKRQFGVSRKPRFFEYNENLCTPSYITLSEVSFVKDFLCPELEILAKDHPYCNRFPSKSNKCFHTCRTNNPENRFVLSQCKPNSHMKKHQICSKGAIRKQFCANTNKMNNLIGTNALYSESRNFQDASLSLNKKGCEQKIQFGQKVACSNNIATSSISNIQIVLLPKFGWLNDQRPRSIDIPVLIAKDCCANLAWI